MVTIGPCFAGAGAHRGMADVFGAGHALLTLVVIRRGTRQHRHQAGYQACSMVPRAHAQKTCAEGLPCAHLKTVNIRHVGRHRGGDGNPHELSCAALDLIKRNPAGNVICLSWVGHRMVMSAD